MITALIYPHQLFKEHPALASASRVLLVEEPLFFTQYKFHYQKLLFHRTSMEVYRDYLERLGYQVTLLSCEQLETSESVFDHIESGSEVVLCEVDDDWLEQRLTAGASRQSVTLRVLESPGFFLSKSDGVELFQRSKGLMASFYREQRLREQIFVERGKPLGGKWSFDAENRKRLPKGVIPPKIPPVSNSEISEQSRQEIAEHFLDVPGERQELLYPFTFAEAERALEVFFSERFYNYGTYQDAISADDSALFHSLLSPLINVGLLTPRDVVRKAISFSSEQNLPFNTVEGFIRQIIGWREYVRAAYHHYGRRQRTRNFFGHARKLPASFWNGTTGIIPVDTAIKRVLRTGYLNHIERLMVIGNFMLLCEFDPDDVYRWFMELFIDAYDWVMVSNVYGMSQFADGGLITTKPYISSSNYVLKMSNYKTGSWCEIWDGLYWRFVDKHRELFAQNQRTTMMVLGLDRLGAERLQHHRDVAERFLNALNS